MKKTKNKVELFVDGEWFIGGKLFLLGYANTSKNFGSLFGKKLTKKNFNRLLKDKPIIFCYGPDVGILEKNFGGNLKKNFICINLLTVFRNTFQADSYRLGDVEKLFGINRQREEYKKSIFDIYGDWLNPVVRKRVIQYNKEDVINMLRLRNIVFKTYKLKLSDVIKKYRMQ